MNFKHLLLTIAVAACANANAASSINLANYQVTGNYALPTLGTMGLEASAVTYARDRGTLFFVGDEGKGVVEMSRTGQVLGSMTFSGWPATSTNNDAEGLTYLGNGVLVVSEERLQDAFKFTYVAGGNINLATAPFASIGATVGNVGIEGISYDARDGSFWTVKQDNPVELRQSTLTFAAGGGTATTLASFSGAASLFGLNSFSDIQTLSPVDALIGSSAADNLLVLSLDSKKLIEINRAGVTLSSFDLAGVTAQAIEGVTIDEKGIIYLVAEDSGTPNSRLFVLTPVPEPETWGMMVAGLFALSRVARRQNKAAQ